MAGTVRGVGGCRRINEEVMGWMRLDLDEQFCISQLRTEGWVRILNNLEVFCRAAADVWFHVPELTRKRRAFRSVEKDKTRASSLMFRCAIESSDLFGTDKLAWKGNVV